MSCDETERSSDDPNRTLLCQPCQEESKQLSAVVYCVDCLENLCQRCYECHLVPSLTKKHTLNRIKEANAEVKQDECDIVCPAHMDENIKYHCATHSFLGCHVCFYKHQKTCKDTVYIPEISDTISSSESLIIINKRVDNIINKCTELASYIQHQKELTDSNHTEAISAMKKFKQKILDLIDNIEKDITDKSNNQKVIEHSKLDLMSKECQMILMETQKIASNIENQQNKEKKIGLYIIIEQSKDTLLKMEASIQGFTFKKSHTAFKANTSLSDMLKSRNGLGTLQMKETTCIEKMEFEQKIDIRSPNDCNICKCRGSVLLTGNKLIINDLNNNSVKLVDTEQNKMISALKLSSKPYSVWGVCKISDILIAVTLSTDCKIVIVRTDLVLSVEREIRVNGNPYGIVYHNDKLVVGYSGPSKVEIMDMQGTVISTFVTDSDGRKLFNGPYFIAINANNSTMYVSNHSDNNVVGMKFDGSVVATYRASEMINPMQVTFDSCNNVYVCCYTSNNVLQMTEDCKQCKVLLADDDKLVNPSSIWYNEIEGKMYIGQNDGLIKVYQLTYSNS